MNSLVSYYSEFSNTAQVAEAIGEALEKTGTARVVDLKRLTSSDLKGIDLLVVGVPTHKMNLPKAVPRLLRTLPRKTLGRDARFAAFDTSYKMSRWLRPFTASHKLSSRLRRLGGKRAVPPETFHVMGREGPLYDGEIERARSWATSIAKTMVSTA